MTPVNAPFDSQPLVAHFRRALAAPAWLRRWRLRCASPDCELRGHLWPTFAGPSFLGKSRGVMLDGRWYCSGECLLGPLMTQVRSLLAGPARERPRRHRVPLGLLLVNRGSLSPQQLREALQAQASHGGEKLGSVLRHLGFVPAEEVTAALAHQWGCPVFPLDPQAPLLGFQDLVPLPLLESACAVPVYVSPDGGTLHLAFGERLDHTTLYSVERMLGRRTIACVAEETAVVRALEEMRRRDAEPDSCFDTMRDPREIAWTIRSYAGEYRASQITLARASSYLWVRFVSRHPRDLLFRIRSAADPIPPSAPFSPKLLFPSADRQEEAISDAAVEFL